MWYNQNDVLNDLTKFTGSIPRHLDRNFVVYGQNAPPPPGYVEEVDDEFNLRFGYDSQQTYDDGEITPDLHGIKEMLKMVDEQNCTDEDLQQTDTNLASNSKIIISKLNPHVEEFVPKSANLSVKKENIDNIETNAKNDNDLNNIRSNKDLSNEHVGSKHFYDKYSNNKNYNDKDSNKDSNNKKCNGKYSIDNDTDSKKINKIGSRCSSNNSLSVTEFNTIVEALKTKISNATKSNSYALKRQKNIAISSLLRLYTESPGTTSPVKLMTPNDFAFPKIGNGENTSGKCTENKSHSVPLGIDKRDTGTLSNETLNVTIKDTCGELPDVPSEKVFDEPSKQCVGSSKEICDVSINEPSIARNENHIIVNTKSDTDNIKTTNKAPLNSDIENDSEVVKSINKVTNWLEPKRKEIKKSSLHLGPVLYKRKGSNKSPTSATRNKVQKPDQCYKPSSYAEDLIKKYTENLKIRESRQIKPTLENLEQILKMKDEEIRRKRSKNVNNGNSARS
ncbi:hypothetical protein K1T71_007495 [Dendrolimus kikuchii]|uniref:Uncharacterized protein n=1 Tax=Dendrolimus kikuchii TaxID=765133 RepID=A0ACC1D0W8_9NEOP|nr:hypothetical protein K1T71_007495 [Dendrolimus kikuchii]